MSDYSLNSWEARAWLPWFRDILDSARDLPPRPATLLLARASAPTDGLSGCFVTPGDDLDRVSEAAAEVRRDKPYTMQVRLLS